jgi:hypothetical protein
MHCVCGKKIRGPTRAIMSRRLSDHIRLCHPERLHFKEPRQPRSRKEQRELERYGSSQWVCTSHPDKCPIAHKDGAGAYREEGSQ